MSRRIRYISPFNIATRLLPSSTHPTLRRIQLKLFQSRIASLQEQLRAIIKENSTAELTIVFPPSLDWSAQMFQHPEQIASALAANGARVFLLQHRED